VTSGTKSGSEPPAFGPKPNSITSDELHCKRCGGEMVLATLVSKFGDQSRFKLFRCRACGFYDWIKA
jgi:DNA-directed RNA polymerase subunit M/transcription elongation factor TFIIS